jgi:anaerobic selenocysteine-containing dehydrogenase
MIVKTYCARMDHGGCGILAHVENGKITKIEGDPDSLLNRGIICAKGHAQIEKLTSHLIFCRGQVFIYL